MKPEDKQINVLPGAFGKQCSLFGGIYFKRCKLTPKFNLFGEDGKPYLSRLEGCVCVRHLPMATIVLRTAQLHGTDNNNAQKIAKRKRSKGAK